VLIKLLGWLAAAVVVSTALLLVAGRLGWLMARAPEDLGVHDGKLKRPSSTPNSVSSQATLWKDSDALVDYATIAPLPLAGPPAAAIARLRAIVAAMPGASVVTARDDYLYATFTTRVLQFVDDVELYAAPAEGVVHVRSASRLGRRDFGVNRARIEAIRAAYGAR
jgi:uncharacterized protein (DUF1499 family)